MSNAGIMKIKTVNTLYFYYILVLVSTYCLLWPVMSQSPDMWAHLSNGRYFFEHHCIPQTGYFSFITPERHFSNYSWLFQVLLYGVYKMAGFYGIIGFRTVVMAVTLTVAYRYLAENNTRIHLSWLFMISLLVLIFQSMNSRPYVFSFLFVIVFLYILEFRTEKVKFLPLLALAWNQLHGVEYPIMILVVMAYTAELFFIRLKSKQSFTRAQTSRIMWLVVTMATIFINGHPMAFIKAPFSDMPLTANYFTEIQSPFAGQAFSIDILRLTPKSTLRLFFILTAIIVGYRLLKKKIRLSHLLILAGGLVLLNKGWRFSNEYVFLIFPWLKLDDLGCRNDRDCLHWTHIPIVLIILCVPFCYLQERYGNRPRYPFAHKSVPDGITTFLKKVDVKGNILNNHMSGAYLQWQLTPNYKIFITRQLLDLFNDEDLFIAVNVISDPVCLGKFIERYHPGVVSLPREPQKKVLMKEFPDFIPVFFDDLEVLYLDRNQYPRLAETYHDKWPDPYGLETLDVNQLNDARKQRLLEQLLAYQAVYTPCRLVLTILADLYAGLGQPQQSFHYARLVISNFPDEALGYELAGAACQDRKDYQEAVKFYRNALEKIPGKVSKDAFRSLYVNLWMCYTQLDLNHKAYNLFRGQLDIYDPQTSYQDFYRLAHSAGMIGALKEAAQFNRLAAFKVPAKDQHWAGLIARQKEMLKNQLQ